MAAGDDLPQQIHAHLTSKGLPPRPQWLEAFISTANSNVPLAALKQTALFRLLASDITTSVYFTSTSVFPSEILNADAKQRILAGPIAVQVHDVEDISGSRWSQIEALEAAERGEATQGREIVRVVAREQTTSDVQAETGHGPFKLLLQDSRGSRVYGFELEAVDGICLGMSIGCKMILRNVLVARGVLLLTPETVTMVGGKIESMHKSWAEGRKDRLRAASGST